MSFEIELAIIAVLALATMIGLGAWGLHDGRHLHT